MLMNYLFMSKEPIVVIFSEIFLRFIH